jgi:hypothetical protein
MRLVKNSDYRQVENPVHSKRNKEHTTGLPFKILFETSSRRHHKTKSRRGGKEFLDGN